MIRYRRKACSTNQAIAKFDHIARLGQIKMIVAKRFRAARPKLGITSPITHECIMVYGEHGTARFEGLCWGYSGEGPRGTHALLKKCGVPEPLGTEAAFKTPRMDNEGVDWIITNNGVAGWFIIPAKAVA